VLYRCGIQTKRVRDMSFYSDASLVMIPSGYKTSKVYSAVPTDGSGDLVFSRSNATATRVGPDGLIEKVRTNLALYSEDLTNAVYTKTNATITANSEIAPDGTLTADTITATSALGLTQGVVTITSGLVYTMSGWLKRKTGTGLINLRGVSNTNTPITITNDWVRYSVSLTAADTTGRYGVRLDVSGDEVYAWGFQLEVGDVMTDYIATTTAAVSVGPVANVPRLDYLNSSCPRLLLEPQRTNLALFSEQFDNAYWTKSGATITANATTSPDGYVNADKLVENSSLSSHYVSVSNLFTVDGSLRAWSLFVKEGERRYIFITNVNTINSDINCVVFDTRLGVFTNTNDPTLIVTRKVQALENGWYRIDFTSAVNNGAYDNFFIGISSTSNMSGVSYLGDGTSGLYIWGAQLEAGAYVTSYIPTLGASVTRGADACVKTGISSLIGQTEGTIYWEGSVAGSASTIKRLASLSDGSTNNAIYIQNAANGVVIQYVVLVGGVQQLVISVSSAFTFGERFKVAAAYKANDFVIYINGTQVGSSTSGSVPATSKFAFDRGNDTTAHEGTINEALLFKTRLSNADLAALTA